MRLPHELDQGRNVAERSEAFLKRWLLIAFERRAERGVHGHKQFLIRENVIRKTQFVIHDS
jgi:hypothetical protein